MMKTKPKSQKPRKPAKPKAKPKKLSKADNSYGIAMLAGVILGMMVQAKQ